MHPKIIVKVVEVCMAKQGSEKSIRQPLRPDHQPSLEGSEVGLIDHIAVFPNQIFLAYK